MVEGRDIGSVVFPDAPVKLFLVASPAVRIDRRAVERGAAAHETADALLARDRLDARTTPPEAAPDAVVIDTTDRSEAATLDAALAVVARPTAVRLLQPRQRFHSPINGRLARVAAQPGECLKCLAGSRGRTPSAISPLRPQQKTLRLGDLRCDALLELLA